MSTAYCNPGRKYVDEEIYPTLPPVEWKHFVDCTLTIPDEYFNSLANYIKVNGISYLIDYTRPQSPP